MKYSAATTPCCVPQQMKRVFGINVLKCPYCGAGKRKLIAMITEAPVIRSILKCLGLPCEPPAIHPALWPT